MGELPAAKNHHGEQADGDQVDNELEPFAQGGGGWRYLVVEDVHPGMGMAIISARCSQEGQPDQQVTANSSDQNRDWFKT